MYAVSGFDFAADRKAHVDEAMRIHDLEKRLGLGPYSPMFDGSRQSRHRRQKRATAPAASK